ncbi:MAG: cation:proton antiporter, partial [Elusimicrobia bacterium]|nr:cation:proton antiporter [Elusimicrobiota bacterium]
MEHIYLTAAFWLGLGVLSAIIAYHIKLSIASVEIIIGIAAAFAASSFLNKDVFSDNSDWIKFLAGSGSIFLTFLAGAELDKHSIKEKFKESAAMGAASFFVSFVLIFIFSFYVLKWSYQASIITASSLSSTSIAIIY